VIDQAAGRQLVVHDAADPDQMMDDAKRIHLIGDMLGGAGIHHQIEGAAQPPRNLAAVEIDTDGIALDVDGTALKSKRRPERRRRRRRLGEILRADRRQDRRRGATEQPVGLRQSRCDHQRIGNLLRADFHDARGAVERALLLQLDQIVEENVAEAHG
jgi:hypothetical protein